MHTDYQPPSKDQRLAARISQENKKLLEYAARLKGITLTDFLVSSAYEEAVRTIQQYQTITLSPEESMRFARQLLNPPSPNPYLQQAFMEYQASVDSRE